MPQYLRVERRVFGIFPSLVPSICILIQEGKKKEKNPWATLRYDHHPLIYASKHPNTQYISLPSLTHQGTEKTQYNECKQVDNFLKLPDSTPQCRGSMSSLTRRGIGSLITLVTHQLANSVIHLVS